MENAINSETLTPRFRRRRQHVRRDNLQGWVIIGPLLLYYAIFGIVPLVIMFDYAFKEDSLFGGSYYVGLQNFVTFFSESRYYGLLFTTLILAVFIIALSLVLGMIVALLATGSIRGKGVYRTVYYVPVVISTAVVAQIANIWLSYNNGTVNNLLTGLGLARINWYESTFWMYFWIIVICVWKGLGGTVILLVAGLNAIPPEIYEAADVDGAKGLTKFFKVTLPGIRPMMVFVMITSIIGAFNLFEPVQLISGGGPDGSTKVVMFQIYNEAFQNGNYGMGSAISVIVMVILMALTVLNMRFGEERDRAVGRKRRRL